MLKKKVIANNDFDVEKAAKKILSHCIDYAGMDELFNFDVTEIEPFKFMEKGINFYIQGDIELHIYKHNERGLNPIKFNYIVNFDENSNSYVAKFKMYAPENIENKAAELIKEL